MPCSTKCAATLDNLRRGAETITQAITLAGVTRIKKQVIFVTRRENSHSRGQETKRVLAGGAGGRTDAQMTCGCFSVPPVRYILL